MKRSIFPIFILDYDYLYLYFDYIRSSDDFDFQHPANRNEIEIYIISNLYSNDEREMCALIFLFRVVGKIDSATEDGAADRSPQPAISNAHGRALSRNREA